MADSTIKAILTDIEGTTSSLSFVQDVLFPYADRRMAAFLRDHWEQPEVAEPVQAARRESGEPLSTPAEAATLLRRWIAEDRKATPLKTLQGMIWRSGYENGDYRAHVYPDAVTRLQEWHANGVPLYVYSSGSIAAQKLFFRHSEAGDLTPLFRDYFDTTHGGKKEAGSYAVISAAMGVPAADILFLSDVEAELDAAREAGLATTLVDRSEQFADGRHPRVTSFLDLPARP